MVVKGEMPAKMSGNQTLTENSRVTPANNPPSEVRANEQASAALSPAGTLASLVEHLLKVQDSLPPLDVGSALVPMSLSGHSHSGRI